MCAGLAERYGVNPMDVWRETEAKAAGCNSSKMGKEQPIDAGMEAAKWKFYYRDPGCVLTFSTIPCIAMARAHNSVSGLNIIRHSDVRRCGVWKTGEILLMF